MAIGLRRYQNAQHQMARKAGPTGYANAASDFSARFVQRRCDRPRHRLAQARRLIRQVSKGDRGGQLSEEHKRFNRSLRAAYVTPLKSAIAIDFQAAGDELQAADHQFRTAVRAIRDDKPTRRPRSRIASSTRSDRAIFPALSWRAAKSHGWGERRNSTQSTPSRTVTSAWPGS